MKHLSGDLICAALKSRWGCNYGGSTSNIATEITDKKNNVLLPNYETAPRDHVYRFTIPGYDGETADWLTLIDFVTPKYVEKGAELRIWYNEDLRDYGEPGNQGRHCVDVYAKIGDGF